MAPRADAPVARSPLRAAMLALVERTRPRRSDYPRTRDGWTGDLLAGLTVGIVALPLALGFGIGAGLGAGAGLVTAIVAGIVAAVFGGSNVQVSGPTGAMTVVLVPVVAEQGTSAIPLLAVLAGLLVLVAGWAGLGRAVTLIPWPVVEGFTLGIAAIIFLQQLPLVLDARHATDTGILPASWHILRSADWSNSVAPLVVALAVIVVMHVSRQARPTFPGSLVAVIGAAVACVAFNIDVGTIGSVSLDSFTPGLDLPGLRAFENLLPSAGVIALLASLESLLSARVADGMSAGTATDPDRELVGQGLANIASGLVGGMPATGAIARTAVNARAGAHTRAAAIFHGIVLLAVMLAAMPLVAHIPYAALAGVLMMTAFRMADVATARALLRSGRADALVFVATAATTVLFDLVHAVEIGVVIAAAVALRASARASGVREQDVSARLPADGADDHVDDAELEQLLNEHIVVYRLQGALFFGVAQHFLEELTSLDAARVVVLRFGQLDVLDASGAHALAETVTEFDRRGITTLLCGVRPQHRRVLAAVGLPGPAVPPSRFFDDLDRALADARRLAADAGGAARPVIERSNDPEAGKS
ncbi:MAG: SulP family inorganic anion transporter [Thermoleophilia bacterium]|nr:SulP family inorganic anion transporter [Thermoleophilia bacterium]